MRVIRKKTNCWCSNCDRREAKYVISSETGDAFKLFWANDETDGEISFCESCAKELLEQLSDVLK